MQSSEVIGALNSEIVNGSNSSVISELTLEGKTPGQLHVRFSIFAPKADYKVVYTDYLKTSLVFSCFSIGFAHWKWAWILVRNSAEEIPEFYYQAITDYGIPLSGMISPSHIDCSA